MSKAKKIKNGFMSLPKFIICNIMLEMGFLDLLNFLRSNKTISSISNNNFWYLKTARDYPNTSEPLSDDVDWKYVYKIYYKRDKILEKINFDVIRSGVDMKDFEYSSKCVFEGLGTWNVYNVCSRLSKILKKEISMKYDKLSIYGMYSTSGIFKIFYDEAGDRTLVKFYEWLSSDLKIEFIKNLKFVIYSTEPTYFNMCETLEEIFPYYSIYPQPEKIQPFWYFHDKKNYFRKLDYILYNSSPLNYEDFCFTEMFRKNKSYIFHDNPEIIENLQQNGHDISNKLNISRGIKGHYLGTPFIIYIENNKVMIRAGTEKIEKLINKITYILKNAPNLQKHQLILRTPL